MLLHGILQCLIGYIQTAVVGSVLAQGEFAIGIEVGQNFYIVKEVAHDFGTLLKFCFILRCPPVLEIAIFVKLCALVVKSVCHFVSYNYTDCAIVAGVVGLSVEKGGCSMPAGKQISFVVGL